jgi:hypothetical protein
MQRSFAKYMHTIINNLIEKPPIVIKKTVMIVGKLYSYNDKKIQF